MIGRILQQEIQALLPATSASINNDGKIMSLSVTRADSASSDSVVTHLETAEAVSELAGKYNVRNMSPREMSVMSHELYQNGAISFQDHALLSFQSELGAGYPGATNQADTPKDFIAHWEQQLKLHEEHGEASFAQHDRRILNILGNLEAMFLSGNA